MPKFFFIADVDTQQGCYVELYEGEERRFVRSIEITKSPQTVRVNLSHDPIDNEGVVIRNLTQREQSMDSMKKKADAALLFGLIVGWLVFFFLTMLGM